MDSVRIIISGLLGFKFEYAYQMSLQDFESAMEDIWKRTQNADVVANTILIVILPQNAAAIRTAVKRWGDVNRGMSKSHSSINLYLFWQSGIRTQCIREGKVGSANNQYYNNVALKYAICLKCYKHQSQFVLHQG